MAKQIMAAVDSAGVRQLVSYNPLHSGYEVIGVADDSADALRQFEERAIDMLFIESWDSKTQEGKANGLMGWIVKPFKPEQMIAVVKKVLG